MTGDDPILFLLTGGIHSTAPVSVEPQIELSSWSARKLSDGDVHLVGWNIGSGEGRVSTAVTVFDAASCAATTGTGRRYLLRGAPGADRDAEYVWNGWLRKYGIDDPWEDVTDCFWAQIEAARPSPA